MQIEDIIVKAIDKLSRSMSETIRRFKENEDVGELFNLTFTQLHYLHAVSELNGPTFSDLAEKFNVEKSTVTAIISKLTQRGYLYKVQSTNDLRVFHIYLAEKGKRLIEYEGRSYQRFAQTITENLSDEEKLQFAVLLNKMEDSISRE
ncbi:MAG: transcriptional regulator, MarR family [Firmicutes bacterium]|nr:transcriptional regulator, MarR family [Bacillota bacterium]